MIFIASDRRKAGAVFLLAALLLAAIAIASYSINVAYMQYVRTELQIATDVASRAACRALVDTGSELEAYAAGQRLADANRVAGNTLRFEEGDFEFFAATRYSDHAQYAYHSDAQPNAVRIHSTFFERAQNSLPMLFPMTGAVTNFRPWKEATATLAELDLAIVLDCSESMLAALDEESPEEQLVRIPTPVPENARWSIARSGIQSALAELEQSPQKERVALITFSTLSLLNAGLTSDFSRIESALDFHGQTYVGGRTSIADGINSAIALLNQSGSARPWSCRVILLISDGKENFTTSAINSASSAANAHIMIYSVSIADEANSRLMQSLSAISHGRHFHAKSSTELVEHVRTLNRHLPILITR